MARVTKSKESSTDDKAAKRKEVASAAIAAILKHTGQKPMGLNKGTWPHVPTGALVIDQLIGGTPLEDGSGQVCPGYPCGRIIEIYGAESSGKTTLALAAIVQAQKAGGLAMFLDYENSLHHGYAKAIGVDFSPERLLYYTPSTFEEGMKMMGIAIRAGVDIVVVDSVAAMIPQKEMEKKELGEAAAVGVLARAMSNVLPKLVQILKDSNTFVIFLNQTRSTISTFAGAGIPEDNTAGGKALKFYSALRLKLTKTKAESIEKLDPITRAKKKIPYGNHTQVKVTKNKIQGSQGHTGNIFIRFGSGVDEYLSFIEGAVPRKIIVQSGASYSYGGENFRGRDSLRKYLIENPVAFEALKKKVIDALIAEAPKASENLEDDDLVTDLGEDEDDGGGLLDNDAQEVVLCSSEE